MARLTKNLLIGSFSIVPREFNQKTEVADVGLMWWGGYLCHKKNPCLKTGMCGGYPGAFECKAHQLLIINEVHRELQLARDKEGNVYRLL